MNRSQQYLTMVALSLMIVAPLAADAGNVKGLDVSPSPATRGASVSITVYGENPCNSIDVDFGDGMPRAALSGPLPKTVAHTYTMAATVTITASGLKDCRGEVSRRLTVRSYLADLCAAIDCAAGLRFGAADFRPIGTACPHPRITGVTGAVRPGGVVIISGCGFGTARGEAHVLVEIAGGRSISSDVLRDPVWFDGGVVATVPLWTGVMDSTATLKIKTSDGRWSNEWGAPFRATRDLVRLPPEDIGVVCSNEADSDSCNSQDDFNFALGADVDRSAFTPPSPSIYAFHSTGWDPLGGDDGTDRYCVRLKNGWVFQSMNFSWEHATVSPRGFVRPPAGFVAGSPDLCTMTVTWSTDILDTVRYVVDLFITGPLGVPYR